MSERYRIKAEKDELIAKYVGPYVVQRKTSWFFWSDVLHTYDPVNFEDIVRKDMERLRRERKAKFDRKSFKPIHAVSYWLLTVQNRARREGPELQVQIDTKG